MTWRAIVPLKDGPERKTRLARHLSPADRIALTDRMAGHVLAVLIEAGVQPFVLSPLPWAGCGWEPDRGGGLNAELDRVCAARRATPLLVIHADLPSLTIADVYGLIAAAEAAGAAIAPDKAGTGTNALALAAGTPITFAFGPDSLARHKAALPGAALVRRPGLAGDIDTAGDLAGLGDWREDFGSAPT